MPDRRKLVISVVYRTRVRRMLSYYYYLLLSFTVYDGLFFLNLVVFLL